METAAALLDAARGGAPLEELDRLAGELQLPDGADRAFWINVYNALVRHAARRFDVRESVKEVPGFFRRAAYTIGGLRLSLDDIEHGILRANRGRVAPPHFRPWDPRRRLAIRPLDRRIHFALNCGAASCPPVRHYTREALDGQLDLAGEAFVNGGGVRLEEGRVVLSPLFRWYWRDFGWNRYRQLASVVAYLDPARHAEVLAAARRGIRYGRYDWHLP